MRWVFRRRALVVAMAAGLAPVAGTARAADVEPSYGRVDGDLTLVAGVGGSFASGGARGEGELRLRYLESVGLFGTYEDALGGAADPRRVLAAGLELRPLFLYRWLQGRESRRAWMDLTIDSFALELGAAWGQPVGAPFAAAAAVQAGLGLEVPILPEATGPWIGLHGGVRWREAELASGTVVTANDREAFLAVTLAWHQVVVAHLVDVGDEAPQ